ncbi:dihydroorotase [Bacilli bacterium PM5-3]|nr:dihydroorotase [Bacilli bacterium PM5-3]
MSLNKYCLKNGLVYYKNDFKKLDILIEDGYVIEIGDIECDCEIIDCSNKLITPSFIDVHVHFRTPGFSYKEDLKTGSIAALKGGYSHVCEMPNTKPCLDDYKTMVEHLNSIKNEAYCHIFPFSAASINLEGKEMVNIDNLSQLEIAGFSDDGKGIQSYEMMKEVLIKAGENNKIFSGHCEDESEFSDGMGCIGVGKTSESSGLKAISNRSEYAMIARDIEIITDIHNKKNYQYHVCHISTKESLDIIKQAKERNYNVSCEVTPHHLISDESEIDIKNSNYKMNPPLRSRNDVDSLVAGLNAGVIEVIATDHAPHTDEEKNKGFDKAPFGIIGLELAFSLLNTYLIKENKVELKTILKCLIDNPSRLFKIDNSLKVDNKAYLNIIDLDKKVVYTKDNLKSKSSNTFYLNRELFGKVETTIFEDKQYHW